MPSTCTCDSIRQKRAWRALLTGAAATALVAFIAGLAQPAAAQADYPTKPIRLIVGFAPGGPSDTIARVVGAKMSEFLGQQVVIENRTGAGGTIATEHVVRAEPDGYTLMLLTTANATNETLFKDMKYRVGTDLVGIAPLAETNNVLVVHPSLGTRTLAEFIERAKRRSDDMFYATAGVGSSTHLTHELFNMMAGTKMKAVHYRGGGPALKDLLSGEVKIMFASIAPVLGSVREGKLLALGTTGLKRDRTFPDLPTVAEYLPGFEAQLWLGLGARAGTPRPIIDRLWDAAVKAVESPDVKERLMNLGFSTLRSTPEEFEAFYKKDAAKWKTVIETTGMERM